MLLSIILMLFQMSVMRMMGLYTLKSHLTI